MVSYLKNSGSSECLLRASTVCTELRNAKQGFLRNVSEDGVEMHKITVARHD